MSAESELQKQAAIARSNSIEKKILNGSGVLNDAYIAGYDADIGADIVQLTDGSKKNTHTLTSGTRGIGDTVLLVEGEGIPHIDANPHKKSQGRSKTTTLKTTSHLKLLGIAKLPVAQNYKTFLYVGDESTPMKLVWSDPNPRQQVIFDSYSDIRIDNTDSKSRNSWIITSLWKDTSLQSAGRRYGREPARGRWWDKQSSGEIDFYYVDNQKIAGAYFYTHTGEVIHKPTRNATSITGTINRNTSGNINNQNLIEEFILDTSQTATFGSWVEGIIEYPEGTWTGTKGNPFVLPPNTGSIASGTGHDGTTAGITVSGSLSYRANVERYFENLRIVRESAIVEGTERTQLTQVIQTAYKTISNSIDTFTNVMSFSGTARRITNNLSVVDYFTDIASVNISRTGSTINLLPLSEEAETTGSYQHTFNINESGSLEPAPSFTELGMVSYGYKNGDESAIADRTYFGEEAYPGASSFVTITSSSIIFYGSQAVISNPNLLNLSSFNKRMTLLTSSDGSDGIIYKQIYTYRETDVVENRYRKIISTYLTGLVDGCYYYKRSGDSTTKIPIENSGYIWRSFDQSVNVNTISPLGLARLDIDYGYPSQVDLVIGEVIVRTYPFANTSSYNFHYDYYFSPGQVVEYDFIYSAENKFLYGEATILSVNDNNISFRIDTRHQINSLSIGKATTIRSNGIHLKSRGYYILLNGDRVGAMTEYASCAGVTLKNDKIYSASIVNLDDVYNHRRYTVILQSYVIKPSGDGVYLERQPFKLIKCPPIRDRNLLDNFDNILCAYSP